MERLKQAWAMVWSVALLGGYAGCQSEPSDSGNDPVSIGSVGLEVNLCARCNDGNPCTIDTCTNPTTGACSHTPASTATSCDDKNACTSNDKCNGAGACRGGALITCNDNNPCTNDSCNKITGCAYVNNTATCNDNSKCTTNDRCTAGACTGVAKNCNDGNACTNDSCNPTTGACVKTNNAAPCASDGNLCTNDVCGAGVCTHPLTAGPCNDGNACTTNDHCTGAVCSGSPLICNDNNVCTNDSCNPASGCVALNNTAPCASDGNPCTNDVCSAGSCSHPSNALACNDNNSCTSNDHCSSGTCGGSALDCDDDDSCTSDACDTTSGCIHSDNGNCANTALTWPGTNNVTTVDGTNVFGANLSGLSYEPALGAAPKVLWAVSNSPSKLYKLVWNGTIWTPQASDNWSAGKTLRYTTGSGSPDTEGVTRAEYSSTAIYVATERNNDVSGTSRLSILRFDSSAAGTSLTATNDWNVTSDLPAVGSNLGLEAITWIPDSFLVSKSFYDEAAAHTYNPAEYPNHGTGLFLVGMENNGVIYAYALNHTTGAFQRIATIASGHIGVMGLEFDRDIGVLWAACDNTCNNESTVLDIDTAPGSASLGRYKVRRRFAKPSTLANLNNEGIAIAPESECSGGMKSFFWTDDGNTSSHALRRDSIPCGSLF